ncbi:hypothetical protein NYR68_02760 [Actinobacillus equuli subsp. haemolyticus]|uniref:hypothetical protein n=1 Tax=Actinobacillus equuli TaxID=718 RepID=UPI0024465E7A|nr:hypothetical protein [Actinobacillus equuli]WGE51328.1 hypothetical protein NYR68_02760 [Actinobacillus equuli subsp. haemolyticus]
MRQYATVRDFSMNQQKFKLPPRKWYSLEQASEKVSRELGEKVTEKDIIYYANQGYLELSIYIDFEKIEKDEYKLEIRNSNLSDDLLDDVYFLDIHCWQSYPKLRFIQGDLFKAVINDEFDYSLLFEKMGYESRDSELGLVDEDFLLSYMDDSIPIIWDTYFNDLRITKLKTNIEKLKGFFAIDLVDFEEILIDEENPVLNTYDLAFRPSRNENINNGFAFCISALDCNNKPLIEISKKSIFITAEEIDNLINADKKMRSLNDFESYIEEWKQPTRIINPTTVKQEEALIETDTIKMFKLKNVPNTKLRIVEDEQKIIEKTGGRMEKHIIQTPHQYNKEYARTLVIESCIATAKDYPTAGKNTIVKAVIKKIKSDTTIKGVKLQSERTYVNRLDEMGITFPDEKGKTIEISKVTIIKP